MGRRRATDVASFADDLSAQIQAMADGHEIAGRLAREGGDPSPSVPIADVVRTALAPWLGGAEARVQLSLDPALRIESRRVSGLTMLLAELETNAIKHGALRPEGGRLLVTLEETRRERRAARLVWNERLDSGVRARTATGSSGLGSVLIEHARAALRAEAERALRPEGLKMTVVLPLAPD